MSRIDRIALSDRRRRSSALRILGEALVSAGVCDDIGPLESAANQCASGGASSSGEWGYDVTLLTFRLPTLDGSRPTALNHIAARLNVSLIGRRPTDVMNGDPFSRLAVDCVVVGRVGSLANSEIASAAWHFDRHVGRTDEPSTSIHPLYHAQYGGRQMHSLRLGETLLCDAPRLIYPPMDAILAVDFVVSNFSYGSWLKLREDPSYVRIVAASYREFWQPWFSCIKESWAENAHIVWHQHQRLCPALPAPPVPSTPVLHVKNPSERRRQRDRRRK